MSDAELVDFLEKCPFAKVLIKAGDLSAQIGFDGRRFFLAVAAVLCCALYSLLRCVRTIVYSVPLLIFVLTIFYCGNLLACSGVWTIEGHQGDRSTRRAAWKQ